VQVFEAMRDARGVTGKRLLASSTWEKRPEQPAARLSLSLPPPTQSELLIEIDNGDNPPLVLAGVSGEVARARIDFVFRPGEDLTLLSDNPGSSPARYDLSLLGETLLATPALPAQLAPVQAQAPKPSPRESRPIWFWAVFIAAGGLVLAALAKLLKSESG
jgi:hypothetical protein